MIRCDFQVTDTVLLDGGRTLLVDNATGPVKLQVHGGTAPNNDVNNNATTKLKVLYPGVGKMLYLFVACTI